MQAVTDEQLIIWVAGGDKSCLGALFERYHRAVYQYCLQLTRQPALAEDLVQEVFIKIMKGAKSFRGDGSFKAWMFNIARNVTFDHLRRNKRQVALGDEAEALVEERGPQQQATADEDLGRLAAAMSRLPEAAREVIWLGRYQFDSFDELARAIDCTPGAARVRMHRAMKQLNELFDQQGGETLHA